MKATYSVIPSARLVRCCATIACFALLITSVQTASAELIFKLQDTVVISNGVSPTTGTLHGVLQLTGSHLATPPNNIMSVNMSFQTGAFTATAPDSRIAFSTPQEPSSGGLIVGGNLFTAASDLPNDIIRFADDAVNAVTAFNNARLVSVPFSVNAGITSATIPVNFLGTISTGSSNLMGNELGDSAAQAFTITLMGGTITVRPIPEPHSILLALLATSLVALRRRHR
jgi:hypothetical protein